MHCPGAGHIIPRGITLDRMKKKNISKLIIFLLIVIGAAAVMTGVRLRNGVQIKAGQTAMMPQEVAVYRQDDMRWAQDALGDSSYTMESSGCLTTCIASAVSMGYEDKVTPGELNTLFSVNNVYDGEGNIQWTAIEKIGGYKVEIYADVTNEEIDICLIDGHYPIVRVRMHGVGNFHYVLIVGIEDGDYICMDPLENELTKLSRYFNRVYALRIIMRE